MIIRYKNDLNRSYMIIGGCSCAPESFAVRMLESNAVPGLLKFHCEQIDGELLYYYDIAGMQSFGKMFETEKMSSHQLENFLSSLKQLASSISEFLLEGEDIVFIPGCIFADHSCESFYFCCAPGNGSDQIADIRKLVNMLISVIDYNDPQAVNLAFSLSSAVRSDYFTISSLSGIDTDMRDTYGTDYYYRDSREEGGVQEEVIRQDPEPSDRSSSADSQERKSARKTRKKKKTGTAAQTSQETETITFKDRAKTYFKGKSFSDLYDDMNSGTIIRKIRSTEPEAASSFPYFTAEEIAQANGQNSMPQPSFGVLMEDNAYSASSPDEMTARLEIPPVYKRKLEGCGDLSGISAPLDHFPFTIGKGGSGCDLRLNERTVSRIHCRGRS